MVAKEVETYRVVADFVSLTEAHDVAEMLSVESVQILTAREPMQANTKCPKCECGVTIGLWNIDDVLYCPDCYTPFVRRQALVEVLEITRGHKTGISTVLVSDLIAKLDEEVNDETS